jgi:glycosidase
MQWTGGPGAGFTRPDVEPWLPIGDADACNVADQREDPGSVLHLCRDLIALRRARADLRTGGYTALPTTGDAWAWRRGERTVVATNPSDREAEVSLAAGEVLIGTRRERDGEPVRSTTRLGPWEALVVAER